MNRWLRILKHRLLDEGDARRALGVGTLERLQARVASSERAHSGEIRICVEAGLPLSYLWRGATARQRAVTMFGKLRVWDTEHNNGVLIYLLLAEHSIEIVADRGLSRYVEAAQWQALTSHMAAAFKAGRYEEGLNAAVDAVSALLDQHFPVEDHVANPNELPDAPVIQ
ncbi:MAG: TPM domain-containing protein [Cytophagales bacterium]|nr:TPM domain-containing protein [Rhizobacter sp.]